MKKWFKGIKESEYVQKQLYFMSSVGLFYIIIIGLFAVPLLAALVVVFIQGVFDFRYIILGAGVIFMGLAVFFGARFLLRLFGKLKRDSALALQQARKNAGEGESVQLELLGGLLKLSYNGGKDAKALPHQSQQPLLIEDFSESRLPDSDCSQTDPVEKLKELSELKESGILEEEEFLMLKKKLIQGFLDSSR